MDNGQRADKLQIICEPVCVCRCLFVCVCGGDDSGNFKGASKTRKQQPQQQLGQAKCLPYPCVCV